MIVTVGCNDCFKVTIVGSSAGVVLPKEVLAARRGEGWHALPDLRARRQYEDHTAGLSPAQREACVTEQRRYEKDEVTHSE